jgi:galactokinase/mevalonate kinase-like predicted kinase
MNKSIQNLEEAGSLQEIHNLIDLVLQEARTGKSKIKERRLFLRYLIFNKTLIADLATPVALDYLFSRITKEEWSEFFGSAVDKELPHLLVDLVDQSKDVGHKDVLRFLPAGPPKLLFAVLKAFNSYLEKLPDSPRCLHGMRIAHIQMDIYRILAADPEVWKRRTPPPCCIDNKTIRDLKEKKQICELPAAYEERINLLQRRDLRLNLAVLGAAAASAPSMQEADYEKAFRVEAPLRLGISSANASDNHIRSKQQGGKTLNASIDLQLEGETAPTPPLRVMARRLAEPSLVLRSLSMDFKADFEVSARGDAATQSELFFAYRRGGDESLRLVKQALVHTGIVRNNSEDVIRDITDFSGGGLEITTTSKVMQGSGLGTSSILAAAILKVLYRLTGNPLGAIEHEYPGLYDQSLLLEQSIGLNSGWQDARGACGGPSAVKDFYAPPTAALPAPKLSFLTGVDEDLFAERIVLFDTGISRAEVHRGLNVVLEAYLSRAPKRYAAMRESLEIHDQMVAALGAGDYAALGLMANRYWQLRCILDPGATSKELQYLFEAPEMIALTEGGLITGAGGGGFALLIAREAQGQALRKHLLHLQKEAAYAKSSVVEYRLNKTGICLSE